MGHVDHGKTSLLDAIRATNVTEGEAGGITQHIGAYSVELPQGKVTFLDTPGHEAFTAIRARGSKITDIVVLVVAADDGVMPQTIESIDHAKAAGVPIIVAVNKMDKEGADPDKVTRQLSEKGLVSEAWGGDTMFMPVSALKKTGIKELLEAILLQAEVLQLKAYPHKLAQGSVIEAKLDRFRGPLCTLLVQDGTLKLGDPLVVGSVAGKVRAMSDWKGASITEAGPSLAVEILGLESVPEAGESFNVVASEQDAKEVAQNRAEKKRSSQAAGVAKVSLEDMFSQIKAGKATELNIILKTDVQGSLEAVRDAALKLGTDDVKCKVISVGVGGITESDVILAATTQSIIIGFNVRPETSALHSAKEKGVDIRMYKIIYDLINDVKLAMQGLLAPLKQETYLGRAEVKQVFEVSKLGFIAGSVVVDGELKRSAHLRLLRDNVVVYEGKVASLKRFKEDVREVKKGLECGVGIEGFRDIRAGDVIEAFDVEMVERVL
jgi:translation initiation factor IF-2